MLELKNITKQFGERIVLNDVSLKLNREKMVFVLGRSGVGKSVLLKIMVGLLFQDRGEVWIDGEKTDPRNEGEMARFRRRCGLVFQMPALLDSLTVEENLRFGLEGTSQNRVLDSLEWVQVPQGLLKSYPSELSFGMQKKVSVLRTLLRTPQYILFDEPTTGLDPVATELTNKMIQNVVKETKTGCLIVSHDIKSALKLADLIVLLSEGRVVFQGSSAEFLRADDPMVKAFIEKGGVGAS